jgi:hypothetical protein
MYFAGWPSADGLTGRIILEACVTTVIIVTALGITHQLLAAVPRRGGHLVYLLLLMALNIVPLITSAIQDADLFGAPRETIETVASLSPGAYYVMNMARWAPDVACGWLVALYACLAALSYWLLQSWLRRQTAVIDRKLQSLDLRPTAHPA